MRKNGKYLERVFKKDNFVVDSLTDAWICDLGKFEYAVRMITEDLIHGEFHVGE